MPQWRIRINVLAFKIYLDQNLKYSKNLNPKDVSKRSVKSSCALMRAWSIAVVLNGIIFLEVFDAKFLSDSRKTLLILQITGTRKVV